MMKVDLNDLSLIAKIKSEIAYVIGQIENGDGCTQESALTLRRVVVDLIEVENGMSEAFTNETKEKVTLHTLGGANK